MKKHVFSALFATLFAFSNALFSQTWAKDVAPILFEKCASCHRPNGLGPFSLLTFEDAMLSRYAIQSSIENREMPPWKPDPTYRHLAGQAQIALSNAEIALISSWVDTGAPSGDLAAAPAQPVFSDDPPLGTPDFQINLPVFSPTLMDDEYRAFVVPTGISMDKFIRAIDITPGNRAIVHHVLVYADTTGKAKILDAATPEPGYLAFGGPGVSGAVLLGGWVPGSRSALLPENIGIRLPKNADLIVQFHYPAGSAGQTDQSTMHFYFNKTTAPVRQARLAPLINHAISLQNGPLFIPAGQKKTFYAKQAIPSNLNGSLLAVSPHMHLIGRNMTVFITDPAGDTIPLIRINDWDFHWQGGYAFRKMQPIFGGSTIHAYAEYDNTDQNHHNPSSPPQNVAAGESTTDEMLIAYFLFTAYEAGDENFVLDSTLFSTPTSVKNDAVEPLFQGAKISPNPVQDFLRLEFNATQVLDYQAVITDAAGREVQFLETKKGNVAGKTTLEWPVFDLPDGAYFLNLKSGKGQIALPFLQQK